MDVESILRGIWTPRMGRIIPEVENVALQGGVSELDCAIIFADLASSTYLIAEHLPQFSAHVVKSFLAACARAIRFYGGHIRSYDGDRVMALYAGPGMVESAAWSAFTINTLMRNIIIPALTERWNFNTTYRVRYGIGLSTGTVRTIRAGIHSHNDLVFLGLPTNQAGKLSQCRIEGYSILATNAFFNNIADTRLLVTVENTYAWTSLSDFVAYDGVYGTNSEAVLAPAA